jgi:hypothetical protein
LDLKHLKVGGWITNPKKAAYNRIYNRTTRGCMLNLVVVLFLGLLLMMPFLFLSSCSDSSSDSGKNGSYVKPSIDRKGRFRKGHFRKSVSTSKDAFKNQRRSRYYYQTKGKYRWKLK